MIVHCDETFDQDVLLLKLIPKIPIINFIISCVSITVLLIIFVDVYFLVTIGCIPNWHARRHMKMMAL